MMTAARVTEAAKEGSSLLAKGAKAAAEMLQSNLGTDPVSLDAALDLSSVHTKFEGVVNQFKINEPDVLAAYKFTNEIGHKYNQRRAAVQRSDVQGA